MVSQVDTLIKLTSTDSTTVSYEQRGQTTIRVNM